MTTETLWYCARPSPPHCTRLSRQASRRAWTAAIDLAVDYVSGRAGYRRTWLHRTGEEYWVWRSEWWLIPYRVAARARALVRAAVMQACRERGGTATDEGVAQVLRRSRRTGAWRRHAVLIYPKTGERKKIPNRGPCRGQRPLP